MVSTDAWRMAVVSTAPFLTSSIAEVTAAFRSGALTPIDVLDATFEQLAAVGPVLNAIPFVDRDGAREAATASTERWRAGTPSSAVDGVPVTVKDSINAVGLPWRHGSRANTRLPVAVVDAPPAARLREAGAVIVGKTSMPDFGMLASGVSSLYGIVRNPWDLSVTPGGSSSGAGASLAAGLTWGAIGTDIAGSVRLPAAHCGIVALKPTQGRIPHLAPSTVRSAGPMARSVAEVQAIYEVVARYDARDTLALADEPPGTPRADVAGLRIGLLNSIGYGFEADAATVRVLGSAAEALRELGATIVPIPAPLAADSYGALDTLYQVRALTEYEALEPEARSQVLPRLVAWLQRGRQLRASDAERAAQRVAVDQQRFAAAQRGLDLVLSPVLPTPSFPAEQVGLDEQLPLLHCSFTAWFNQTGQPALALPFGDDGGHPVAVQLAGPRFADRLVLAVAARLEAARGRTPAWPTVPRIEPGQIWKAQR